MPEPSPNHTEPYGSSELSWLKQYGFFFPLVGFPLGLFLGARLWNIILLQKVRMPGHLMDWITPKGIVLGLILSLIPAFWWLTILLERKAGPWLRRWPAATLLGVAGFLLVEGLFRSFPAQSILWQSVRARAGNHYLARELSLLREDTAYCFHAGNTSPGLVIIGPSQLIYGIDYPRLTELIGLPVYKRAVAGLFPTELTASQGFSDFNSENQLLLMVSGFDIGARSDWYPDAIRPLATAAGMRNLVAAAPWPFLLQRWRAWVDLEFAAHCELWRSRDYLRFITEHPFSPARMDWAREQKKVAAAQQKAYQDLGTRTEMVDLCLQSLTRFFQDMSERSQQIIVFEGQVNSEYPSKNRAKLNKQARDFFFQQEQRGLIRYVPLEEQDIPLTRSAWKDMTHVSESGKTLFTEMFGRVLNPPSDIPGKKEKESR